MQTSEVCFPKTCTLRIVGFFELQGNHGTGGSRGIHGSSDETEDPEPGNDGF